MGAVKLAAGTSPVCSRPAIGRKIKNSRYKEAAARSRPKLIGNKQVVVVLYVNLQITHVVIGIGIPKGNTETVFNSRQHQLIRRKKGTAIGISRHLQQTFKSGGTNHGKLVEAWKTFFRSDNPRHAIDIHRHAVGNNRLVSG